MARWRTRKLETLGTFRASGFAAAGPSIFSMSRIFTVRELTRAIRDAIEGGFPFVWVQGQVSNLSRPSSGHLYFTLKDEEAALQCVWFKGNQREADAFDPLTGEVYEKGPRPSLAHSLQNGQELLCAGRLTVYPPRGGYQLVVELVQETGLGKLHLAFEELKRRLSEKGYFSASRKRPLPARPVRVAVITAPGGAAVRDFLRIADERGWGAAIHIHPVPVQGDDAPPRIVAALRQVAVQGWAEVVVLIRGGGSIEDLWAFNDERVADAVHDSPIPVLAGIGHEVDFTIADMTADVRAATPTHAAQILWPERRELQQRVDELEMTLQRAFDRIFIRSEERLSNLERGLAWLSPERSLARLAARFEDVEIQLGKAWERQFLRRQETLQRLEDILRRSMGPAAFDIRQRRLDALDARLLFAGRQRLDAADRTVERLALSLAALDPEAPLHRGYSLVRRSGGAYLRSVEDVTIGDDLEILLADGEVKTVVRSTRKGRRNDA